MCRQDRIDWLLPPILYGAQTSITISLSCFEHKETVTLKPWGLDLSAAHTVKCDAGDGHNNVRPPAVYGPYLMTGEGPVTCMAREADPLELLLDTINTWMCAAHAGEASSLQLWLAFEAKIWAVWCMPGVLHYYCARVLHATA